MGGMLEFDAERGRYVEVLNSTPDVVEQRRLVLQALELRSGERVLDVGSGAGFLALDMAAVVGPDGRVCGIDVSEDMLPMAKARAATAPPDTGAMEFRLGAADRIPYSHRTFDVVVSTQVFEYVTDVPAALTEILRVLRPGGRVLILDTDWDSIVWRSSDDARMERILKAWEQHLVDPRLPRYLAEELVAAGFESPRPHVIPMLNAGYDPSTYSANLIQMMAGFVRGRDGLYDQEVDDWAADLRSLGERYFFSLNRYLFTATKPEVTAGGT